MNINSDLSSKVGFTHQLWAFQVANLTALKLSLTRENRDHDTHTAGWLPEITRSVPSIRAGLRGEPVSSCLGCPLYKALKQHWKYKEKKKTTSGTLLRDSWMFCFHELLAMGSWGDPKRAG